jgi:hypothetical protein
MPYSLGSGPDHVTTPPGVESLAYGQTARAGEVEQQMTLPDPISTAIVAGGLALSGAVVAQWIDRRHHTRLRKKQSLERMVDLISESQPWFFQLGRCRSISEIQAAGPPLQVRQVVMVARLSFPSLVDIALRWSNSHVDYYHMACDCFRAGVPATLGAQMQAAQELRPELQKIADQPYDLRNMLDTAIVKEAKQYQDL